VTASLEYCRSRNSGRFAPQRVEYDLGIRTPLNRLRALVASGCVAAVVQIAATSSFFSVQSPTQHAQDGGKALASRSFVTWQVRVWDATGAVSGWSAPATFQIGLTKATDWTGEWIKSTLDQYGRHSGDAEAGIQEWVCERLMV
jgi:hypothetical protein